MSTSYEEMSVNEKYQKKTHLEHIKDLPDTYIGSIEEVTEPMWVIDESCADDDNDGKDILVDDKMEKTEKTDKTDKVAVCRPVTYIPGLYKIFDEVLVNAGDHKMRCPALKHIKVSIEAASGRLSVWNDGSGIDIDIHAASGVYAPELIFGHLLTSGNYDPSEKKVTGGRNGYGAKLANIFSTEFYVETVQGDRKYQQHFRHNMTVIEPPVITSAKGKKPYVLVAFVPDYVRFGMPGGLTRDMVALLTKRVYDLAATTTPDVTIWLNGGKVPVRGFEKYMDLYVGPSKKDVPRVYQEVNERWAVGACTSPDGTFRHVSFVNGIWTYKGGKHVDYIADQLARRVTKYINDKKAVKVTVKESYVKSNLWVFVRCLVENPAFSSQTKEELVTLAKNFGSKGDVSEDFVEKLAKSGVMDKAVDLTAFREKDSLKKTDGRKRFTLADIPKLDDANKAGGAESHKCTLILTEGDSAKTSVVSGLSVVGRDYFGVFPLKGKLLNVREATTAQLLNNEEIKQLKKILGLQHYAARDSTQTKEYVDTKELRYGRVLIMTDADVDGSHIKGLLINFFHFHWPSLLRVPNFLDTFKTPLVKATKKGQPQQIFYSLNEYEAWKAAPDSLAHTWGVKYYKGLGTSTPEEFKDYFRDMTSNLVHFHWTDDVTETDAITLAFKKERSNDRKTWLHAYNADPRHNLREITSRTPSYSDFVHSELVHFSNYDNIRSIPHLLDGLKPSQRKVLFACLKRNLTHEIKVSQLSGYVSEQTSYHHGEMSLQGAIIGMAQQFVGANNLNLLVPNGQFGTRIKGGDDAASPRYIFTHLHPLTLQLFNAADAPLLPYLDDDGVSIEPQYYLPILPMVLINGTNGIGTGFRSQTPCYNTMDIYHQLHDRLVFLSTQEQTKPATTAATAATAAAPFVPLHPWYKKYQGTISLVSAATTTTATTEEEEQSQSGQEEEVLFRKYVATGTYTVTGDILTVTELPVGTWTQNYKEFIEACMEQKKETAVSDLESMTTSTSTKTSKGKKAKAPPIVSYENHCTDEKVLFSLKLEKGYLATLSSADIVCLFKLSKAINTSSMYLYNAQGAIQRYRTPEDILEAFFAVRMAAYDTRKAHLLHTLQRKCIVLENKVKFVQCVLDGLVRWNQTEDEVADILSGLQINKLDINSPDLGIDVVTRAPLEQAKVSYHYLLDMKIRALTQENVIKLKQDYDQSRGDHDTLALTSTVALWLNDLEGFKALFDKETKEADEAAAISDIFNSSSSSSVKKRNKKAKFVV